MKVHQAGLQSVVSLVGSALSDAQEEILRRFAKVVLFFDGDGAGREAAREIAVRLAHYTFVRVMDLPNGKQPDQLSSVVERCSKASENPPRVQNAGLSFGLQSSDALDRKPSVRRLQRSSSFHFLFRKNLTPLWRFLYERINAYRL